MENYRDMENYSNAMGYGFWCGKKCAQKKIDAGIPPLGAGRATKAQEADNDSVLAQAALEAQRKPQEKGMSALALTGVIGASLLGIALMVVIIRRSKRK
jgi:hypothetical protein|tara:strand:- start:10458 stop:10754 length:297 start_codon:yes stop_codon:yes gene_type:complete